MFRSRLTIAIEVVVLALGMVPVNGNSQVAIQQTLQQTQKLSKKKLKLLIANACSPEDHERIASYYRAQGDRLKAKQREHEKELAEYLQNPSSHPVPKWPTMGQVCRNLVFRYSSAAQKAFALADLHEQMARDASA